MAKKSALGRGLGALIDDVEEVQAKNPERSLSNEIEISKIEANPYQPNKV